MQEPITIYTNKKIFLLYILCAIIFLFVGTLLYLHAEFCANFFKNSNNIIYCSILTYKILGVFWIIMSFWTSTDVIRRLHQKPKLIIQITNNGFREKDSDFISYDDIINLNIETIAGSRYINYTTKEGNTRRIALFGTGTDARKIYQILRKNWELYLYPNSKQETIKIYRKKLIIFLYQIFCLLLAIFSLTLLWYNKHIIINLFFPFTLGIDPLYRLLNNIWFWKICAITGFCIGMYKFEESMAWYKTEVPLIEIGSKYFSTQELGTIRWKDVANIVIDEKSGKNKIKLIDHDGRVTAVDCRYSGKSISDIYETMYKYWQTATHEEN